MWGVNLGVGLRRLYVKGIVAEECRTDWGAREGGIVRPKGIAARHKKVIKGDSDVTGIADPTSRDLSWVR